MCMRNFSAGMPSSAWFIASTWNAARFRNSASERSWNPVCLAIARSGQSSCNVNPAATIVLYSSRIAAAIASI